MTSMTTRKIIRTYDELIQIPTFEERYKYLATAQVIGQDTFGGERYLNQQFYKSKAWLSARDKVITRDMGCDLAMNDREISGMILVHHMTPLTIDDILEGSPFLLDPRFLVCTCKSTHDAIHFGSEKSLLPTVLTERRPGDTRLW